MTKRLFLAAFLTMALAACGGDDDDGGDESGGGGGGSGPGTAEMAGRFGEELTRLKECVKGQVDGGPECTVNFLNAPVTRMCSDVRLGKPNAEFPQADLTRFTATCADWQNLLSLDANAKLTTLEKMIADTSAIE